MLLTLPSRVQSLILKGLCQIVKFSLNLKGDAGKGRRINNSQLLLNVLLIGHF